MAQKSESKIALISGASGGISSATNVKMASLGATLAFLDINSSSILDACALCANIKPSSLKKHFTPALDKGSTVAVSAFMASIILKYRHIDCIFKCACISPTKISMEVITDGYWDKIINANLEEISNITRASLQLLRSNTSFINVSSTSGICPSVQIYVDCATSMTIKDFSKSVVLELRPESIRPKAFCPGAVNTPTNVSMLLAGRSWRE
jgi:NAD(P)-dependent dehydrogenase (short-subunit alcohol dehydrogenase family)